MSVEAEWNQLLGILKSLSQEHRIRILHLMASKGPLTFSELVNELHISGSKLNFHLKKLRDAGLVEVSERGAYELTEVGKRVVSKLIELAHKAEKFSPIVDYRGLPSISNSMSELVKRVSCGRDAGEIESFFHKLLAKFSRLKRVSVSEELLLLLAETMFCDEEPSIVCIPRSLCALAYKSFMSREYTHVKERVLQDLARTRALEELSPLIREYQARGLAYVKDPAYSIRGAQVVAMAVPRGVRLAKIVCKLVNETSELLLAIEELSSEDVSLLNDLVPPGRVTIVLRDPLELEIEARGVGLVYQLGDNPSACESLLKTVNSATPILLNRGESIPSLSLADAPSPEPGEAYVLPLRAAVSLPALYRAMRSDRIDGYRVIELIAEECHKALDQLQAPAVRRALKGMVDSVELLEPQLALVGFEAALELHHPVLPVQRLMELSRRFWSTIVKGLPVKITAALADEGVYALGRVRGFTALSAFSLSPERSVEELALLEGALQRVLNGGSVFAVRVKGYLTHQLLERIIALMGNHGVLRASVHLEFTRCSACRASVVGRRRICHACLSSSVEQLVRPLTIYEPLETVSPEVLSEYESRLVLG